MTPAEHAARLLAHPTVVWPSRHRSLLEAIAEGREPDVPADAVQLILVLAEAAAEAAELAAGGADGR